MLSSQNQSHSLRNVASAFLSVAIAFSFGFTGCSKPEPVEKEEKKVVQDLNIETPEESEDTDQKEPAKDDSAKSVPATKAIPASHEDEVETFALDLSGEAKEEVVVEEELPLLGSGG